MKTARSRRSGSTMVEFALTLPVLALLLFGIIQWGLLFAAHITVRNASSVGARFYAINPTNPTGAQAVAKDALKPMLNPQLATAATQETTVGGQVAYQMTVSYPLPLFIPFVVPGAGSTRTLTATTITR